VIDQVRHVCQTTIMQDAWTRSQRITVHGWIYDVGDGLLRDLRCSVDSADVLADAYAMAING
jgi:carbonic anhydrase